MPKYPYEYLDPEKHGKAAQEVDTLIDEFCKKHYCN